MNGDEQAQLSMDEDMEDLLEHIEEDVDLPDDDEEEEDDEINGIVEDLSPDKKAKFDSDIVKPVNSPNGIATPIGAAPGGTKLPPLPPLPPPLLNLEFLKVQYMKS